MCRYKTKISTIIKRANCKNYSPIVGGAGRSLLVTAGLLRSDREHALRKELPFSILLGSVLLGRLLTSASNEIQREREEYKVLFTLWLVLLLKVGIICKVNVS